MEALQKKHVSALICLWLLLYGSFTLFRPPLLDDADSVHSEVAREMLVRHDWITLYANGIRYLEKAPLMYWSMALSFRLFGPEDWAARLPLALYALGLFLVVYAFGCRLFASRIAGFYAALILLTSCGIFLYTRIMIPDVIVCLWLAAALLLFWRSLEEEQPSRWTAWGFAAICALNVLTKGLIGLVFPLGIVILFLWLTRNLGHLRRWHPFSSMLIFLAIAVPWHLAAGLRNPAQGHPAGLAPTPGNVHGFFWFYFINEQYLRYLNQRVPRDYDTVPLALFWGLLVVWLAPWFAYFWSACFWIACLVPIVRRISLRSLLHRRPLSRTAQAWLLLGLWAAFVLLFFSFSTRQEYYALPALAPLALMIGGWLAAEESDPEALAGGRRIAPVLFFLGAAGAAIALFFALHAEPPAPGVDLSTLLSQNPAEYALSLGHFLDLSGRAMGAFRTPLWMTAAALFIGTLANWLLRRRRSLRLANCSLAAMMAVFLIAAHIALVTFSPVLSSKALADAIRPKLEPGDIVEINGEYEAGSTLGFYLRRQVRILNGRSSNLWYGSFFADAPAIFDNDESFARLWSGPARIFLWTEMENVPKLPGALYVIAKSGGKEILSNRR
ncbi:MAG TPA: glycosyltransferase family 39 protein [Acidobacteriaceae bacterium]|nr:glycosyltransferase family 39 protein [Acidobacteriaceae bacterium]